MVRRVWRQTCQRRRRAQGWRKVCGYAAGWCGKRRVAFTRRLCDSGRHGRGRVALGVRRDRETAYGVTVWHGVALLDVAALSMVRRCALRCRMDRMACAFDDGGGEPCAAGRGGVVDSAHGVTVWGMARRNRLRGSDGVALPDVAARSPVCLALPDGLDGLRVVDGAPVRLALQDGSDGLRVRWWRRSMVAVFDGAQGVAADVPETAQSAGMAQGVRICCRMDWKA